MSFYIENREILFSDSPLFIGEDSPFFSSSNGEEFMAWAGFIYIIYVPPSVFANLKSDNKLCPVWFKAVDRWENEKKSCSIWANNS